MKHKFLIVLMAITTALCMAFGLAGCGENSHNEGEQNETEQIGNSYTIKRIADYNDDYEYIEHRFLLKISDPYSEEAEPQNSDLYIKEIHFHVPERGGTLRIARGTTEESNFYNYYDFEIVESGWIVCVIPNGWRLATYPYYKLTASDQSITIDEIFFIAQSKETEDSSSVIVKPAMEILSEASEKDKAQALIDCLKPGKVESKAGIYESGNGLSLEPNYLYMETGYVVVGIGKCKDAEIVIPAAYNGKPVTSIGKSAFESCNGFSKIIIPEGVKSIEDNAFSECTDLTEIIISSSVTEIGNGAFRGCSGLTSVAFGSGMASIGEGAFESCDRLKKVHVTDLAAWCKISFNNDTSNPLYYAHHLYKDGKEITKLEIPIGVTSIGGKAFTGCSGLTEIAIPDSVTEIGGEAFAGCSGLTEITIPDSVIYIGFEAFAGCSGLTEITIPDSVTKIGGGAFAGCSGLTEITIPDSVTEIEDMTFIWCSALTSVTIGKGVETIESRAFLGCYKLVEVWNYSSLKIEADSFHANGYVGDYAKYVYTTNEKSKQTKTDDGYLFYDDGMESYLLGYLGTSTKLTLPQKSPKGNNYEIYQYAFALCNRLTEIIIPDSVTSIGTYAFTGCDGLISVKIGNDVTTIGEEAFRGCNGLTSIDIPDSVTEIGIGAFAFCNNLKKVHFENLNGWKAGNHEIMGLNDPAKAAENLTNTYSEYKWKRG